MCMSVISRSTGFARQLDQRVGRVGERHHGVPLLLTHQCKHVHDRFFVVQDQRAHVRSVFALIALERDIPLRRPIGTCAPAFNVCGYGPGDALKAPSARCRFAPTMMSPRVNPTISSESVPPPGPELAGAHGLLGARRPDGDDERVCARQSHAHARRVSQVATATARTMDLPAPLIEQIEQAALLHDIGKLALAEQDVQPFGPQGELQAVLVRQHVRIGFDVLSVVPPLRLRGVDCDRRPRAMGRLRLSGRACAERRFRSAPASSPWPTPTTCSRPRIAYRGGMSRDEANAEIVRSAGTYFDPDIVRAWLRASDRLECS